MSLDLQGRGAHSKSLPDLIIKCAALELTLERQSHDRDCALRAHNLAQQAVEMYRQDWTLMEARQRRQQASSSSWWPFSRQPEPDLEARCSKTGFGLLAQTELVLSV